MKDREPPHNGKVVKSNKRWIPVVDVLRAIEDVEEAGGGRFAEVSRGKFPKSSPGESEK